MKVSHAIAAIVLFDLLWLAAAYFLCRSGSGPMIFLGVLFVLGVLIQIRMLVRYARDCREKALIMEQIG